LQTLTQPRTPATPLPNLLAAWPGDGSAADPVGGQTGTVQLGTTFGPGVRQQAFVFDGVDDAVSIPDSAVLDSLSTNATLDAWIKPAIPLGAEAWLFARRDPFVSEGFSVALLQDGRMQLTVRTTTSPTVSGSTFCSTASVITFDQWQHAAAAVDTVAGTAQIWVNGQAISLTAVFGPATLSGTLVNVNQQYLGRRQDPNTAGGGGHFKGQLDEVRLYGRTLTLADVQSRAQTHPAATYVYDALSRRTSLTLPNGTQTTYTYDPASQVTNILHKITATNTPINNADYLYNNVGNKNRMGGKEQKGGQVLQSYMWAAIVTPMARPLRIEFPGAVYHVTSRGNARQDIAVDDHDRTTLLTLLAHAIDRYGWFCHAYCLMDNHYHLFSTR